MRFHHLSATQLAEYLRGLKGLEWTCTTRESLGIRLDMPLRDALIEAILAEEEQARGAALQARWDALEFENAPEAFEGERDRVARRLQIFMRDAARRAV